jgi:hypothetical protein
MRELTEEQKRELKSLATLRDEDIDLSEMPEITDFTGFERGPLPDILERRRNRLRGLNSNPLNPAPAKVKRIA